MKSNWPPQALESGGNAGMTTCRVAGITLGALVVAIVISQIPDLIRDIRMSSM